MNGPDGLRQENAALRGRISALSAAILRISASLDLDTVLREVVDSACALTGARYGMIATVDEAGAIQEFIAPGLSAEERRHMAEWPPGHRFFEHLRDLPGALRLADVPAIPGTRPGQRLSSIFEPWSRVRARAGLDDVRIHDLRHSYASRALALGESLPVIAKLLGHAQIQTTARYTHLTRDSVKDAATRVANDIARDIFPASTAPPTHRSAEANAAARARARRDGSRRRGLVCAALMPAGAPCQEP